MSTRFSKSILISGIFIIIGAKIYTPGTGFTFQNIVGAASIVFFGCIALISIYAGIKQLIKPNKIA
jgi:hypothetical protein